MWCVRCWRHGRFWCRASSYLLMPFTSALFLGFTCHKSVFPLHADSTHKFGSPYNWLQWFPQNWLLSQVQQVWCYFFITFLIPDLLDCGIIFESNITLLWMSAFPFSPFCYVHIDTHTTHKLIHTHTAAPSLFLSPCVKFADFFVFFWSTVNFIVIQFFSNKFYSYFFQLQDSFFYCQEKCIADRKKQTGCLIFKQCYWKMWPRIEICLIAGLHELWLLESHGLRQRTSLQKCQMC